MKAKSSHGASTDEIVIQMIPMIDICFLLLTFLLLAARFHSPEGELESNLPDEGVAKSLPGAPPPQMEELRITLRVSQAGATDPNVPPSILIDGTGAAKASGQGGLVWLAQELRRIGSDQRMRAELPIILEAEPHLAYRWVIKALDVCRQAKFQKIQFAASKRAHMDDAPKPK